METQICTQKKIPGTLMLIFRTVMIVLLPMMFDEQNRLPKTTILPADLGAILDPEE